MTPKLLTREESVNHQQSHTEADTTKRLYENLVQAIDETRLVRMIISTSDQIRKIETTGGSTKHTQLLREEVSKMENQLTDIRTQTKTRISPTSSFS